LNQKNKVAFKEQTIRKGASGPMGAPKGAKQIRRKGTAGVGNTGGIIVLQWGLAKVLRFNKLKGGG